MATCAAPPLTWPWSFKTMTRTRQPSVRECYSTRRATSTRRPRRAPLICSRRSMLRRIPLVITSAVAPSSPVCHTSFVGVNPRLLEHLRGVLHWLFFSPVQQLVLCDSTDFDYSPFLTKELIAASGKTVEVLRFSGSSEVVARRGKGFGEGELMRFVLNNSSTIRNANAFFKVTGKLWVSNIGDFRLRSGQRAYFSQPLRGSGRVDTRFYYVGKDIFQRDFIDAYERVDDSNGVFLEHAYCQSIPVHEHHSYTGPFLPDIHGISGTTALPSTVHPLRFALKSRAWSVRSKLVGLLK